jgi:hypothetical protein
VGGAIERRERGRRRRIGLALPRPVAGRRGDAVTRTALGRRHGGAPGRRTGQVATQALRDDGGFAPGAGAAFLLSGSRLRSGSYAGRGLGSGLIWVWG